MRRPFRVDDGKDNSHTRRVRKEMQLRLEFGQLAVTDRHESLDHDTRANQAHVLQLDFLNPGGIIPVKAITVPVFNEETYATSGIPICLNIPSSFRAADNSLIKWK